MNYPNILKKLTYWNSRSNEEDSNAGAMPAAIESATATSDRPSTEPVSPTTSHLELKPELKPELKVDGLNKGSDYSYDHLSAHQAWRPCAATDDETGTD